MSPGDPAAGKGDVLEMIEGGDHSLLELVDNLLNRGVVLTGEVILGVAGIDLIYLQLSAIFCAADRILPRREKPS